MATSPLLRIPSKLLREGICYPLKWRIRRFCEISFSVLGTGIRAFGGIALLWTSVVQANPVGEQVVAGAAGFERVGGALTITQGTDRAVINWNSFSIGAGEITKFVQPNSSSAVLNRVITANNPSAIYGTLQANGQVYLINPAGIFIGPGGLVDTASFVASTHDVGDKEFMGGGDLNFTGSSGASIINQGRIEAKQGDVFLVARQVSNEGQIMASDGTVGMISGTEVCLHSIGPNNYKVRLIDVANDTGVKKTDNGIADVVNAGVIEAANAELESTGNYLSLAIKNTGVIRATGVVPNADGTVTLTGGEGDILNTGVVAAIQKNIQGETVGGRILASAKNITTDPGSIMTAAGTEKGGEIRLAAKDTVYASGKVEAGSAAGKGGKVQVTGERVALIQAEVDVSGKTGGGTVLVGGDYLGKNPEVPNAKAVVMTSDSVIRANATENGDGGKVILWSDEYTGFYGEIFARGGIESGNGGFVETSSKDNLQAFGTVIASAVNGQGGLWLLDPTDVEITAATNFNPIAFANPWVPTGASSQISASSINALLNAGTSVQIQTSGANGQTGNITMTAGISKDATVAGTASTLTMIAAGSINISQAIGSVDGDLSLVLGAQSGVTIGANITTLGGNITIQGAIASGSVLAPTTTTVTINSGAVSTLGGTGNGSLSITANGAVNQAGGSLSIKGTSTITTGGSTITLTQALNDFTGAVSLSNTGLNNVSITDANALILGASSIGGDFSVITGAGAVTGGLTQTGVLTVSGTTALRSSSTVTDINLSLANTLTGAVSITGTASNVRDFNLRNTSATAGGVFNLGNSTTTNLRDLTITYNSAAYVVPTFTTVTSLRNIAITAGGAITQAAGGIVQRSDATTASFTTGAFGITLTDTANNFIGAVSLNNSGANNVAVTDANAIILGTSSVGTGTLTVNAVGITEDTLATITQAASAGAATFNGGAGVITLIGSGNNDFTGAVSLNNSGAFDVAVTDANAIILGTSGVGTGTLTVNAVGITEDTLATITQAASAGAATFNGGAGVITLVGAGNNNFIGAVSLNNSGAFDVAVTDANAIILGTSSVGTGTLTVNAVGITQAVGTTITQTAGAGTATFNAGAGVITLVGAGNNNFIGAVSLNNSGAFDVAVTDANAITLGTSSVGTGTLTVNANADPLQTGGITQGALTTITQAAGAGAATFNAGAGVITLVGTGNNNFTGAVSLNNTGNNAVAVTDANAIILGSSSVGTGTLTVNAVGITQDALTTITQAAGAGAATFNAGAGVITLVGTGNNNFTGAVSLNNSGGGAVAVTDANAIILGSSSVGTGTLTVNAVGITQDALTTITQAAGAGAATFNAGAGVITLVGTGNNNFTGAVSLNNTGNNAVAVTDANAIILGSSSVGTGTLTVNAVGITQDALTTITQAAGAGAATFNAGAGVITLVGTGNNNFTGAVSLNNSGGGAVAVTDANAIILGSSSVGTGTLTVNAVGITQDALTTITQAAGAGAATFNAGAGVITLVGTGNNNFTGAVSLNNSGGGAVAVTDANAIILGSSSVGTGTLTVNAVGITQDALTTITQAAGAGAATFNAGAGVITLVGTGNNNFTGAVSLNNSGGGAVAVTDANAIILGSSSVGTGTLTVNAVGITQDALTTITQAAGAGAATFNAGAGVITLVGTGNNNFTGAVSLINTGSNAVEVRDANAIILGTSTVGTGGTGNLTVIATGANSITQTGALTVTGTSSFTTGAGVITLTQVGNNFTGAVSLSNSGANNVAVTDANALILGTSSIGGNLDVITGAGTATGGLTQTGVLTVAGTTALRSSSTVTDINLSLANTLTGAVSITGTASNVRDFNLRNTSATAGGVFNLGNSTTTSLRDLTITYNNAAYVVPTFTTVTTLRNIAITAGGAITQAAGGITQGVSGTASFTTGAFSITLTDTANNFIGAVSLNNSGANNVAVTDANAIILGTSSVGTGTLTVNAVGITEDTLATITQAASAGAATFNGGAGVITLIGSGNNDFTGAVSLNNSGAFDVAVTDANAIILGTSSVGTGTLTVNAVGITEDTLATITQAASAGAATFNGGAGVITLIGSGNNDFTGAVSLINTGANDVAVTDRSALILGASSLGTGTLTVNAAGITQSGAITQTANAGTATFNAGTGDITMTASSNIYTGDVSITAANADFLMSAANGINRLGKTAGSLVVSGVFTLRAPTSTATFNLANGAGVYELSTAQLNNFSVGTLAPTTSGTLGAGNITIGTFNFSGVKNLSLTTTGTGNITANGGITGQTFSMNSGGSATFAVPNQIQNLGTTVVRSGGLTFQNQNGLNLTGSASMPGRLSLEVAGQFYNQTGAESPLAGVQLGSVIKSLSLMGGLPNSVSGLSGFSYRYDGLIPTSGNVMSYAVAPLALFAPSGTVIAGVDLSGTQTGGGQLNTFLTGSDDLNWIISDFGKFNLPKVSSAGLEYTIYPKRVEPETRTLPDSTLSQLRQELGRPPTMDEINRREVSLRQSDRLRSGSILERSSLDSSEEPVENAKAATPSPIEGQIPQANQEPKKATSPDNRSPEPLPPVAASQVLPDDSFQPNADQRAAVSELLVKERANAEVGLAIPVARSK